MIQRNYDWNNEVLYRATTWREIWSLDTGKLAHARYIRGHFGINLLKLIDKNFETFTFLRNPVKRCLSDLNFAKHTKTHWPHAFLVKHNLTARDALYHPKLTAFFNNQQAANLGLEVPLEELRMNRPAVITISKKYAEFIQSDECLEQAKRYLEQCYFVGISEYFNLAYLTLCYLNSWKPDIYGERYYVADKSWINTSIGKKDIDYLRNMNINDFKLYDYGMNRFINTLNHTFGLRLNRQSLEIMSTDEKDRLVAKIFDKTMKRYEHALTNMPVVHEWTASMPICGNGWHDVHSPKTHPHRWSGPGTVSDLDIRLDDQRNYKMTCILHSVMTPEILKSLKISVNEETVLHRTDHQGDSIMLTFVIKKNQNHKGFVRVMFDTGRTFSPKELLLNKDDTLKRGFALSEYTLNAM